MLGTRILSKWIVLGFDTMVTMFTYVLATVLLYNFDLKYLQFNEFFNGLIIITSIYIIAFLIISSYEGIIRHTGFADVKNLIKAGLIAVGSAIILSLLLRYFLPEYNYIPISISIVHFLINITLLSVSRYGIKVLFYQSGKRALNPSIPVLIYGASRNGINTVRALKEDINKDYKIRGFIDDDPEKLNKYLEGIRIYNVSKINFLVKKYEIKECIIADEIISHEVKNELVEKCLINRVSVKHLAPMEDWINGKITSHHIRNMRIEDLLEREPIHISAENITRDLSDKVVLVTGAAGSIGSEIVRQVIHYKVKKLILVDQAESGLYDLQMELWLLAQLLHDDVLETVICDVTNKERLERTFERYRPEIVFHAAAYKHVPLMETNPVEAVHVNFYGTKNLVDLSIQYDIKKFVFISTDKAVNPTNVMGATKRAAEIYVQEMAKQHSDEITFITTRFGNVLGSSGSVIPLFKRQIENGGPITITHPDITRYFMTIAEACQLVLQASSLGNGGEIFLFDMGECVKIKDLANKMILLSGLTPVIDIDIIYTGLRPGEKLHEELLHDKENSLETPHPKIMVASTRQYDRSDVEEFVQDMTRCIHQYNTREVVSLLKKLIPEYISQNSSFSELDEKLDNFSV